MNCWNAKRRSADFVDGRLRESERARLAAHFAKCRSCSSAVEQLASMRNALRKLPAPKVPGQLRAALRVSASREREAITESLGSPWRRTFENWCYRLDQMMRPITVPATGGVLSTVLLFSALAYTIGNRTQVVSYEVPVMYADRINANLVPVQLRSSVILTLNLDGKGRITDYAVRDGAQDFVGDATRLQYNNIAIPTFPSVLASAYPVSRGISIRFEPIFFQR